MTRRRPDLDRAAAEWLSELRVHRRPWAESAALEAVVATSSWSVVELYRGPSASPWHLTTGSDGSRALWRLVPDTDERVERRRALETAGCPAWVEPLLNVGWSSPGFGGAIGEALTGNPVDATWLAANEAYTGVCAPRPVSPPLGPVFTLQGTEHGAPMLFTSGLEVFVGRCGDGALRARRPARRVRAARAAGDPRRSVLVGAPASGRADGAALAGERRRGLSA